MMLGKDIDDRESVLLSEPDTFCICRTSLTGGSPLPDGYSLRNKLKTAFEVWRTTLHEKPDREFSFQSDPLLVKQSAYVSVPHLMHGTRFLRTDTSAVTVTARVALNLKNDRTLSNWVPTNV